MLICSKCGTKLTKTQTYFRKEVVLNKHGDQKELGVVPICKKCRLGDK